MRFPSAGASLQTVRLEEPDRPPTPLAAGGDVVKILAHLGGMRKLLKDEWFALRLEVDRDRLVFIDYAYHPAGVIPAGPRRD